MDIILIFIQIKHLFHHKIKEITDNKFDLM